MAARRPLVLIGGSVAELPASDSLGGMSVTSLNGGPLAGMRNVIANASFLVAQRGASVTVTDSAKTYILDRWWSQGAASFSHTVSRATTGIAGSPYGIRIQRATGGGGAGNALYLAQDFETADSLPLVGQQVTLSFYASCGANFSGSGGTFGVQLRSGTGTDQSSSPGFTGSANVINQLPVVTTTRQRYTFTVTVPTGITQLGLILYWLVTGTAGANDWLQIDSPQLEMGSVATPLERRPYALELALCRRYLMPVIRSLGQAFSSTGSLHYYDTSQMRSAPTLSATASFITTTASASTSAASIAATDNINGDTKIQTTTSGLVAGNVTVLIPPAGVFWTAEL